MRTDYCIVINNGNWIILACMPHYDEFTVKCLQAACVIYLIMTLRETRYRGMRCSKTRSVHIYEEGMGIRPQR